MRIGKRRKRRIGEGIRAERSRSARMEVPGGGGKEGGMDDRMTKREAGPQIWRGAALLTEATVVRSCV